MWKFSNVLPMWSCKIMDKEMYSFFFSIQRICIVNHWKSFTFTLSFKIFTPVRKLRFRSKEPCEVVLRYFPQTLLCQCPCSILSSSSCLSSSLFYSCYPPPDLFFSHALFSWSHSLLSSSSFSFSSSLPPLSSPTFLL